LSALELEAATAAVRSVIKSAIIALLRHWRSSLIRGNALPQDATDVLMDIEAPDSAQAPLTREDSLPIHIYNSLVRIDAWNALLQPFALENKPLALGADIAQVRRFFPPSPKSPSFPALLEQR